MSISLQIKSFIWKITLGTILGLRYRLQLRFNPRIILEQKWKDAFGYPINWEQPRDLNEKIQFLLAYTDTSQWSRLADKVLVRDYVRECGLEELLVPLYGVWKSAKDIDFKSLPKRFVLKCNHDSGSTLIIDQSKDCIDYQNIRSFYNKRMKQDFGFRGEIHYRRIKRRILAEKCLDTISDTEVLPLVDYKVWCFNGNPHHILTCYGRTQNQCFLNVYDLDWNCHPEYSVEQGHYKIGDGQLARPASLPYMLEAAKILSSGFPEVRVDFYDIDGILYFGEMTFTSLCGRMKYYTPDFLKEMGALVVLPKVKPSFRNWLRRICTS